MNRIEPLTLEQVAHTELEHEPYEEGDDPDDLWCSACEQMWPCQVQQLIATIKTLTTLPHVPAIEDDDSGAGS